MFTARGRESPTQEGKRGITVMTSTTEGKDGRNQDDKAAGPRAWRRWMAAGEEGHREHARGPRGRGVSRAAGGGCPGQGSREATRLEGGPRGRGVEKPRRWRGPRRTCRDSGEPLAPPGGLTAPR